MQDLTLKNGKKAKFKYKDEWDRPVYEMENGSKCCCVNLDGTFLHSMNRDYGEPIAPLKEECQPVELVD